MQASKFTFDITDNRIVQEGGIKFALSVADVALGALERSSEIDIEGVTQTRGSIQLVQERLAELETQTSNQSPPEGD